MKLILVFLLLASSHVFACSYEVKQLAMENLMAAEAASHYNISLSKVTKTTFAAYDQLFIGVDTETTCPLQLQTSTKVSFSYSPTVFQRCSLKVEVTRLAQIFGEPSGPIETYSFTGGISSCRLIGP
jgi:hypothetical protein